MIRKLFETCCGSPKIPEKTASMKDECRERAIADLKNSRKKRNCQAGSDAHTFAPPAGCTNGCAGAHRSGRWLHRNGRTTACSRSQRPCAMALLVKFCRVASIPSSMISFSRASTWGICTRRAGKLYEARSRLYRRRSWRSNTRRSALDETSQIDIIYHSLSPLQKTQTFTINVRRFADGEILLVSLVLNIGCF